MPEVSLQLFFSYSHKDETLRDELAKHLTILEWQGVISSWHDRKILPGEEWDHQINDNLNTADIILLLISSDFLFSKYCWDVEVKKAIQRHHAGEACVIPVILRSVDWSGAPFAKLQALPKNAEPVVSRNWHNQDEAFTDVARGIRAAAEKLKKERDERSQKQEAGKLRLREQEEETRKLQQQEAERLRLQEQQEEADRPQRQEAERLRRQQEQEEADRLQRQRKQEKVLIADDPEMPLGIEEIIPADLACDSSNLDWLGEDTWGDLVNEIEYDDPSYAEDSAIIADLFWQLDEQKASTEIEAQINENSLQNRQISQEMPSSFEQTDLSQEALAPPPQTIGNADKLRLEQQSTDNDLLSEKGVDYTRLRDLLGYIRVRDLLSFICIWVMVMVGFWLWLDVMGWWR
ncbi:MAG: TIR domain-containing protein [Nostoc sp.]